MGCVERGVGCSPGKSRRGNQEIDRALQNRLQTSYTQETTEPPREIECLECEDKSDSPLEEDTEQFLRTKVESMEVAFADRCEEKSNLEKVGCAQRAKRMRRNTTTGLISSQTSCREEQEDPR